MAFQAVFKQIYHETYNFRPTCVYESVLLQYY